MEKIRIGIIVVSDTCSENKAQDTSGAKLKDYINNSTTVAAGVTKFAICPDEKVLLKAYLTGWCREENIDVIITSGGTGFTERDVTPEVTKEVIEKEVPGFQHVIMSKSLEKTKFAPLSRGICGIRNRRLVINLPGSSKGTLEGYQFVEELLRHAVDQLRGRKEAVKRAHADLGNSYGASKLPNVKIGDPTQITSSVDVTKVADRPRESPYPIVKVEEALSKIMSFVRATEVEDVHITETLGRFLSKDALSPEPQPPFPASIKDGYAVIAADGSGERMVVGSTTAGENPSQTLKHGCCMRISTGAPVPDGADAVVQVEDTDILEASEDRSREIRIRIRTVPKTGQDIRPKGSEVSVGQCLVSKGRRIGPPDIGLLCALGFSTLPCHRIPVVGVLSTGNEVVDFVAEPKPGQIRDSNRLMLINLLHEIGCETIDLGIVEDDPNKLLMVLKMATDKCDVVVSSGGVSMGEKDLLKRVLTEDLKAEIQFGRVFMKPGKPTTFASIDNGDRTVLYFGLPGNPVSAIVTCHLFVAPAIRAMQGSRQPNATCIKVRLNSSAIKLDPRPEYHRCILDWSSEDGMPLAISTGNQISARLLSVTGAQALLLLPPRTEQKNVVEKNEVLQAMIVSFV